LTVSLLAIEKSRLSSLGGQDFIDMPTFKSPSVLFLQGLRKNFSMKVQI